MRIVSAGRSGLVVALLATTVGSLVYLVASAFSSQAIGAAPAKPGRTKKALAEQPAVDTVTGLDRKLAEDNAGRKLIVADVVDDLSFLRRISVDMIGRIPSLDEIDEYLGWSASQRRGKVVDKLLADPRFVDRWTVFFSDMLRIRYYTSGGDQFLAFVHKSLEEGLPYDEMCRRLIAANGKPSAVPEVGYVLGDNADPMALAGATSQVFLGVRIACAQCHNHPFDKWTREQFYGLAAYFGKTQRIEAPVTKTVYTTEADVSMVLWPPEGEGDAADRKPKTPAFPFDVASAQDTPEYIERLTALRTAQAKAAQVDEGESIDDLLADAERKADEETGGSEPEDLGVVAEAKRDARDLKVEKDLYRMSQLRQELASLVTDPHNRYFSRNLVNRVWAELMGRGFVMPVDDFSDNNKPSHPATLDYLADEFVAQGFDLRALVRMIVSSEAYQRSQLQGVEESTREESELAFVAAPMRRMLAEVLFDSLVQAGHLFEEKYLPGENEKTIRQLVQVALEDPDAVADLDGKNPSDKAAMKGPAMMADASGYDLEAAVEVDFNAVLAAAAEELKLEELQAESSEDLEMEMEDMPARRMRYAERYVEVQVDDNPKFSSAMRMASPAAPSHFLRIFGQPARDALGDHRDQSASMRQALMMLNGKLTHEASRVGSLEPMYELVAGKTADLDKAVALAYREILTREPSAEELTEAKQIVTEGETPREGMADLRWVLFNCNEFRFLP